MGRHRRRPRWQHRHLIFIAIPEVSTRATLFTQTQDRCVWIFNLRDELRSAAATLFGEPSAGLRVMFVLQVLDKICV
jgi:hypothetical protein